MSSETDTASTHSSVSSSPLSPARSRPRPQSLRLHHVGIDPSDIIGKVLKRAKRSSIHPAVTLDFSDNSTFQILVDGYNPAHPGIPKELEMDSSLNEIFSSGQAFDLEVLDCALITLSDKAFERKHNRHGDLTQWDQTHLGVAFKFAETKPRWHAIWATLEEYDQNLGLCVFRSYDDVYLEQLQRSPTKPRPPKGSKTLARQNHKWLDMIWFVHARV